MRLIIVRHGETQWNLEGKEMGQLDSPLTPLGIQQAEALSRRLAGRTPEAIYSSDLRRAARTAEIIAARVKLPVVLDVGLRERNMGIFQGLTRVEIMEQHPEEWSEYKRVGFEYVIPEGESARERKERSIRVLTHLTDRHPDGEVVVVTHGGFLMGFFEYVLGLDPGSGWRFQRRNASYNSFQRVDDRWSLETWNDVSHLDGLASA